MLMEINISMQHLEDGLEDLGGELQIQGVPIIMGIQ